MKSTPGLVSKYVKRALKKTKPVFAIQSLNMVITTVQINCKKIHKTKPH
jgi:hypothetical protein